MTLNFLNLSTTKVTDLTPLLGMPLEHLFLSTTKVTDLAPLRGMTLKVLCLDDTKIADLSPLKGMPLAALHVGGTPVTDLTPLRGMPLNLLWLHDCPELTDLSPLADCNALRGLTLPPNVKDIEFLRTLPKLEHLSFKTEPNSKFTPAQTAAEFWKEWGAKK